MFSATTWNDCESGSIDGSISLTKAKFEEPRNMVKSDIGKSRESEKYFQYDERS